MACIEAGLTASRGSVLPLATSVPTDSRHNNGLTVRFA